MDQTTQDKLRLMVNARSCLNSVSKEDQDDEWKTILKSINKYIEQICLHDFVYDWIDTDPDRSSMIQYCVHCEKTMDKQK